VADTNRTFSASARRPPRLPCRFSVIIGGCPEVFGVIRVASEPREGRRSQLCVRAARDPDGITRLRRPMFGTP
jgi:hypothetical protein